MEKTLKIIVASSLMVLLAACASKKDGIYLVTQDDGYTCASHVIGTATLQGWVDATTVEDSKIDCAETEHVMELIDAYQNLATAKIAPSELKDWYGIMPSDMPLPKMVDWMLSGIDKAIVRQWYDLGYSVDETVKMYRLDKPINQIKAYMGIGLHSADVMKRWINTGIPFALLSLWLEAGVEPETAKTLTARRGLTNAERVKKYLLDNEFALITTENTEPRDIICSRNNLVGELVAIRGNAVEYVKRYVALDEDGYELPPLALFDKKRDSSKIRISRSIARSTGVVSDWAKCPAALISNINAKR